MDKDVIDKALERVLKSIKSATNTSSLVQKDLILIAIEVRIEMIRAMLRDL